MTASQHVEGTGNGMALALLVGMSTTTGQEPAG